MGLLLTPHHGHCPLCAHPMSPLSPASKSAQLVLLSRTRSLVPPTAQKLCHYSFVPKCSSLCFLFVGFFGFFVFICINRAPAEPPASQLKWFDFFVFSLSLSCHNPIIFSFWRSPLGRAEEDLMADRGERRNPTGAVSRSDQGRVRLASARFSAPCFLSLLV